MGSRVRLQGVSGAAAEWLGHPNHHYLVHWPIDSIPAIGVHTKRLALQLLADLQGSDKPYVITTRLPTLFRGSVRTLER